MDETNETTVGCRWCDGLPCVGDGYLNDAGTGDPCGALHRWDGVTEQEVIDDHACSECGTYTCGIHTLEGGLCPDCGDPEQAAEVLASGQMQDEYDPGGGVRCPSCTP